MRIALVQLSSSDNPVENCDTLTASVTEAAEAGAAFVLTPEVSNCVSSSRSHQQGVLHAQDDDPTLQAMRDLARDKGIHLLLGSLAIKTDEPRFANRSFLIGPDGGIIATYDKIHMFDVDIDESETYRESGGYRPGNRAVVARTDFATLGLCICYDVRFPLLAHALAKAGAQVLTYPAAFSPVTGEAHWESLLRARAIETGCWVLAPAQTGQHATGPGRPRATHGHSLVVDPWGNVRLDAGKEAGIYYADLDLNGVKEARKRVPALENTRAFEGP